MLHVGNAIIHAFCFSPLGVSCFQIFPVGFIFEPHSISNPATEMYSYALSFSLLSPWFHELGAFRFLYDSCEERIRTSSNTSALSRYLSQYVFSPQTQAWWETAPDVLGQHSGFHILPFNIQFFPLSVSLIFPSLAYLPYDKCILYSIVANSVCEPAKCCGADLDLD